MKVAVITRHGISNYGSLLQTIATQQVIEQLGHSCVIIDYIREDETYIQHEMTLLKRKPTWYNNPIKRMIYLFLRLPESVFAGIKFEKAQKKYLKLTSRYTTLEQLSHNTPSADIYMTGSDQVWGLVENGTYDSTYCLDFTNEKKIAYAASFGHANMDDQTKSYYKKLLSQYAHIAVREDSAVKILKDIGLEATQVLDPTLLMDKSYWNRYLSDVGKKDYLLIYQLHNDKKLGKYAEEVAKEKGLDLIRISASFHQIVREGTFKYIPEIGEFLSYIKNARCMITDSFHGTAFAINFNTPFIEILPNNNTGSRNMSILKLTKLTDRILKDFDDIDMIDRSVDFSYANNVLASEREKSINILRDMINS